MVRLNVREDILRCFRFLFDIYGFAVTEEVQFESFANWVAVLESPDCRIRLFQDRGQLTLAVGPKWFPPGWESGPWFDLAVVIEYLTAGENRWEYRGGTTREQMEYLGDTLRVYWEEIHKLFQSANFQHKQQELRRVEQQLENRFWDELTATS